MRNVFFIVFLLIAAMTSIGQKANDETGNLSITVINDRQQLFEGVTIELFSIRDSMLIKTGITDSNGVAVFNEMLQGEVILKASHSGYTTQSTTVHTFQLDAAGNANQTIKLMPTVTTMQGVTVAGIRPFVQHVQGKVLLNVDASITNSGTTVLEVLEKSPGIMVDKNGIVSLQAKWRFGKPLKLRSAQVVPPVMKCKG